MVLVSKKYKYQVWETFNLIQFIRSTTMQTRYTCPGISPHYIFPMGMGSSNMVASILRAGDKQCHVHAWCSWWLSCSCTCDNVTCPGKRTAWITTVQWGTTLGTTRSHLLPTIMQLLEAKDPTVRMLRCLGNILKLIFGFLNLKF